MEERWKESFHLLSLGKILDGFVPEIRPYCAFTPKANCAAKTLWSLIKYRCKYFCSLLSLKSLMTYNSILQTHLKEPYAFSTDSHIKE